MESSKEKIEAQLCAYVEGELDERDRADIERHLQTNPQHKALIAELRRHRDLLQALPRATVPGELNENLTGQLERSALLSDDDETAEAGVRISRWPQITAVAAVLLLAAGLGIVVYYVLPPAGASRGTVAMEDRSASRAALAKAPATAPVAEAKADKLAGAATAPAANYAYVPSAADAVDRQRGWSADAPAGPPVALRDGAAEGLSAPPTPQASAPADSKALLRELTTGPGLVTPNEIEELQKRMARTMGGEANAAFNLEPRNSLYLVVQTTDAAAANGQVTAFFKNNNIQYMNAALDFADFAAKEVVAVTRDADMDKAAVPPAAVGDAYRGGLSSASRLEARGVSVETGKKTESPSGGTAGGAAFGGGFGGGGSGARAARPVGQATTAPQPVASGTAGATPGDPAATLGRSGGTAGRGRVVVEEGVARRELERNWASAAGPAPAASQPVVAMNAPARSPAGNMAERRDRSDSEPSSLGAKAKAEAQVLQDEKAATPKEAFGLGTQPAATAAPAAPDAMKRESPLAAGGAPAQLGQQPEPVAGARFGAAAAEDFDLRTSTRAAAPAEGAGAQGGVIVARMNRRQAGELGAALSREQGQRALLRDFAEFSGSIGGASPAGITPLRTGDRARATTAESLTKAQGNVRGEAASADATPAPAPASEGLRLNVSPMDEPVDVVIVVKSDVGVPAPTAGEAGAGSKK